MNRIPESELILNRDGSVYHLNLLPQDISETIITVGDPDRVDLVASFFDSIEIEKSKREFATKTGIYKGKRLTVISTGIGTDNIDIVFNELDALVNIDLASRTIKEEHKALNIIRIGTSGCMDGSIPIDSILLSSHGVGLDGLLSYYDYEYDESDKKMNEELLASHFFDQWSLQPYCFSASNELLLHFNDAETYSGITTTCTGFYGPQGRSLRLKPKLENLLDELPKLNVCGHQFTNFEMETAGIYGLAKLLGHKALSINLLIANRIRGEFSSRPVDRMKEVIEWSLEEIVSLN